MRKKTLLVCSGGGHLVQLSLLSEAFAQHDVVWAVADGSQPPERIYKYCLVDANKETPAKLIKLAFQVLRVVRCEKPQLIVSTGAAPGLFAILFGRMLGAQTLWLDSIANSAQVSLSGRLAKHLANVTLTQWPHLADNKKMDYWGQVL